jgi:hypothetical protein
MICHNVIHVLQSDAQILIRPFGPCALQQILMALLQIAIHFNYCTAEHVIIQNVEINARTITIRILHGVASPVDGVHL